MDAISRTVFRFAVAITFAVSIGCSEGPPGSSVGQDDPLGTIAAPMTSSDLRIKNYLKSALPASVAGASGTTGRLAQLTDYTKDLWVDTGTQWRSVGGEVFNVKDFGAKGNGTIDDTAAIQAAINAAQAAGGGKVYLPKGTYALLFSTSPASGFLVISDSNVVLMGDGPASKIYVPTWGSTTPGINVTIEGQQMLIQAHIVVANPARVIQNVHLKDFAITGTLSSNVDPPASFIHAMQIGYGGGPGWETRGYANASGFSGIYAEKIGGSAFSFSGGTNGSNDLQKSMNNYVVNNVVNDVAYEAIGAPSGGMASMVICGNRIESTRSAAIEWGSSRAVICDNTIANAKGGAISFEQDSAQTGWSIVSNNTIVESGNTPAGPPAFSIELGQSQGAFRVAVVGNTIRNAYGTGIIAQNGQDFVVENNLVDGFGLAGSGRVAAAAGIDITNVRGLAKVTNNFVRAAATTTVLTGIQTGGGDGQNFWTSGNTVEGVSTQTGGKSFQLNSSAGDNGVGKVMPQTASNVYIGDNWDLDTGKIAGPLDRTNAENIPYMHPPTGSTYTHTVGGSSSWVVFVDNSVAATITELTEGSIGRNVTLVFMNTGSLAGTCTIHNSPTATPNTKAFWLNGDFVANTSPTHAPTLQLMWTPRGWIEVSRSMN
jgi:hypothetical protein